MAVMTSIHQRTQDSRAPRSMAHQSSNSTHSSYSSSLASARTSELSGAYMLSRTDDAPPSYFAGSALHSDLIQEKASNVISSTREESRRRDRQLKKGDGESPPPTITYFPPSPSASMLSVNTYDSRFSEEDLDHGFVDGDEPSEKEPEPQRLHAAEDLAIPHVLCPYRPGPTDPSLRSSDPRTFSMLFPSQGRLSIRHDDTTPDGNMNLRVDTVTSGYVGSRGRRRQATVQLFHLRMHDLVNRHFSLRRYCRDSGREVCFSKRAYAASSAPSRHGIPQSVSSALRSVKAPFRRSNASSSSCFSLKSSSSARRPSTASAMTAKSLASSPGGIDGSDTMSARMAAKPPSSVLVPTDTIKLEFGNYARVEVSRRSAKRYGFEWWGHAYTWKRAVDKQLNIFSFHLMRDDKKYAVAHIVQEVQSPSQVEAEKRAGGWIPPCYMWISDQSVLDAMTDVADVIVATGIVALVDDCIRQEWQVKKLVSDSGPHEAEPTPRRGIFSRRHGQTTSKPLRFGNPVSVY